MFRIKICGVTEPDDALAVADAGADAVGLNFFPPSPRYVNAERALRIVAGLPASVARVGVFVNAPAGEIRHSVERIGLDYVQLHGDEPPELLDELGGLAVIRVIRCRDASSLASALGAAFPDTSHVQRVAALLIDADRPGLYGGSGAAVDWAAVRDRPAPFSAIPWVLAGGLRAENVSAAIRMARPDAVDVASGVESFPGRKDARLVKAFVAAARQAFAESDGGE